MRQLITYFLLFSTMVANGQTSIYHPLPESDAVWNVNFYFYCLGPGSGGSTTYDYPIVISGDTVIQNQLYRKLETPFFVGTTVGNCANVPIDPAYQGAFRQDIPNKKVFFIPPSGIMEQILYDFNMEVGDTVKGYLATSNLSPIVTSIDSILVGNNYRKKWNISSNSSLIEGIGSTFGVIRPLGGILSHEPYFELTCFQENGATLYPEITTECLVVTSIQPNAHEKQMLRAFPNPSYGSVQLSFETTTDNLTLNVFSLLGELIMTKHLSGVNNCNIELPDAQGIYLLQLIDENGAGSVLRVIKE